MSTLTSDQNDRGINSVARHFLTRPQTDGPSPLRMPPGNGDDNPDSSDNGDAPPPPADAQAEPMIDNFVAEVLFADHLSSHQDKIHAYVSFIATREEQIAFIDIDQWEAKWVRDYTGDHANDDQNVIIAETEQIDVSLIPALNELADKHDILLINCNQGFYDRASTLIHKCAWATVLCTPNKADLIETYKTIKWLVQEIGWKDKISIFICLPDDMPLSDIPKNAEEIFNKLVEVTREHLHTELHLIGYYPSEEPQTPPKENLMHTDPTSNHQSEQFFDNMNFDFPDTEKTRSARKDMSDMGMPGGFGQPLVHSPVPVHQLPRSSDELSNVLQLRLPQWLHGIPTPMALPIPLPQPVSPGIRLLIDGNGRIYIFHASLSEDYDLFSEAMTARNWLNQNMMLIQNYCPQLRFDRTQEVGMILVTGGSTDSIKHACEQLAFPVHLLKLHLLQNGSQWSLLILPQ